jgi:NAD+ diphosphatase
VICIKKGNILFQRTADGQVNFPTAGLVKNWADQGDWKCWREDAFQYVFRMQEVNFFLWMGEAGEPFDDSYEYEGIRSLSLYETKTECFTAFTASHLYTWYQNNRFCGACQTLTIHDARERMLRCPECGNLIFPRISPAVIIGVTDKDRILLSKYAGRATTNYALIAGYTEIGETMEETVQREVMEEVGLKVKNIRYYRSQPWGRDGAVLMGFYCDLDGSDEIHLDKEELSLAEWHNRWELPIKDDGISLTREMIRMFEEGKEPK